MSKIKAKKSRWTKEDEEVLRQYYPTRPIPFGVIRSKIGNRTQKSIARKAKQLGLVKKHGANVHPVSDEAVNPDLCRRIQKKRLLLGISQIDIGKIIGVSGSMIGNIERGIPGGLLESTLVKYQNKTAKALGINGQEEKKMTQLTGYAKTELMREEKKAEKVEIAKDLESDNSYQLEQTQKEIDYIEKEAIKAREYIAEIDKKDSDKSLSLLDLVTGKRERAKERIRSNTDLEILLAPLDALKDRRKALVGILESEARTTQLGHIQDAYARAARLQRKFKLMADGIGEIVADLLMEIDALMPDKSLD